MFPSSLVLTLSCWDLISWIKEIVLLSVSWIVLLLCLKFSKIDSVTSRRLMSLVSSSLWIWLNLADSPCCWVLKALLNLETRSHPISDMAAAKELTDSLFGEHF